MLQQTNKGIILKVRITPKSSYNEIVEWKNGELKIRIAAVPEKNAANQELIDFMASFFSVGKSKIELIKGGTSRSKTILLTGLTLEKAEQKLKHYLNEAS